MAAVLQEYDYNFDMFESSVRAVRAGNTAPAPVQKPKEPAPLQVVPKKTATQRRTEERTARKNAAFILVFAALFLGIFCMQINTGAKSYEISRKIATVRSAIEAEKSENVRLSSQLNSITSIGNIDDYATRVLGMVKVESYQVEYIDLEQQEGVLYTSGGSRGR